MKKIIKSLIIILALACGLQVSAAEIEGIDHGGSNVIGKPHTIKLKLKTDSSPVYCGINIDWGDGQNQEYRVGKDFDIQPPYQVDHTYTDPGIKKIVIKGVMLIRGLGSVGPCSVNVVDNITIVDPVKIKIIRERIEAEKIAKELDEKKRRDEAVRLATEDANAKLMEAEKQRLNMEKQLAEAREKIIAEMAAKKVVDEKDRAWKLTPEYKKAQQEAEKNLLLEAKAAAEREKRERAEALVQAREDEKRRIIEEKAKAIKDKKDKEDLDKEQNDRQVKSKVESALLRPLILNNDPRVSCQSKWAVDPRFNAISQKISIYGATDVSFPMLSDAAFPNGKEQQIIALWADEFKKCVTESASFRSSMYTKEENFILDKEDNELINAAIDLYGKKITFGSYNKKIQDLFKDSKNNLEILQQKIVMQKQEQESAARSRAAALKDAQIRQDQQRRDQDQQRQDERRRQDQLRQQEQAKIAAVRQQWAARCEFDRKNAYEKFKKTKENDCNINSAGLVFLCVLGVESQSVDYGTAAFNSCMSGAPN